MFLLERYRDLFATSTMKFSKDVYVKSTAIFLST